MSSGRAAEQLFKRMVSGICNAQVQAAYGRLTMLRNVKALGVFTSLMAALIIFAGSGSNLFGPAAAAADTTAPVLTGAPPALSNLEVVTFNWSLPGGLSDGDTVVCDLDGGGYEDCDGSTSQSYSDLGDGAHTFQVAIEHEGEDEDGDYFSTVGDAATYDFTILTEPPNSPVLDSDYPSGHGKATIVWDDGGNVTHDLTYRCKLDARKPKPCGSGSTGSITYKRLGAGSHTVLIIAVDKIGNQSSPLIVSWTQARKKHHKPKKHTPKAHHKKRAKA